MHIGSMYGRMAAGRPAGALPQEQRVVYVADIDFAGRPVLDLGMAFEAEVRIAFDQELPID